MMDQEEERLRAALNAAAPEVDATGVIESVARRGTSLRKRRRLVRGGTVVLVVAVLVATGFGVLRLVQDLHAVPGISASSFQPAPGTGAPTAPVASNTTSSLSSTSTVDSATTAAVTTTPAAVPTTAPVPTTAAVSKQATSIVYRNTRYGFTFSLPPGWKGYSIVTEQWEGFANDPTGASTSTTSAPVHGPELLIRNPAWTSKDPHQDIPIMVFTLAQWHLVQQARLVVSAAPMAPSKLGSNATYVFALPARYDYAFPTGYKEVDNILKGEPLHGF